MWRAIFILSATMLIRAQRSLRSRNHEPSTIYARVYCTPTLRSHHVKWTGTNYLLLPCTHMLTCAGVRTRKTVPDRESRSDRRRWPLTLTYDLDFQSLASCGHDRPTHSPTRTRIQTQFQRSVGSKNRMDTNERTDGRYRLINAVSKYTYQLEL